MAPNNAPGSEAKEACLLVMKQQQQQQQQQQLLQALFSYLLEIVVLVITCQNFILIADSFDYSNRIVPLPYTISANITVIVGILCVAKITNTSF